MEEP